MVFALNKKNVKTIIGLLFVISGMAGLIYQIVWFKYLGLFLGNTTYAQMTVLATFLGGLALGNFLFGRNADAVKNPVRVYSLLELTIGLYCFSYPALSSILGNVFLSMSSNLNIETQLFVFNSFRFLISAILLLIPTALMGGTLPVLSKFFVEKISESRKEVALLYFLNSFGAVIGVIFAGFILIKDFGLEITNYTTAAINVLLGVAAFALSFSIKNFLAEVKPLTEVPEEQAHNKNISPEVIILVAGISGMAALLYEMVWTRLLINFFGSSTYAFSIMLLSFIGGITIGSFIISLKFLSKFNYVKLLSFCQSAIALSTIAVLSLYERLPYYLWRFSALLNKSDETFWIFLLVEFAVCFALILLPTIFMGMSLPLATEIVSRSNQKIGASVGKIFSVNTLGTVGGVIITGLIFIPIWEIKGAFEIGIALNLFAALLIILFFKPISTSLKVVLSLIIMFGFLAYLSISPEWNKRVMLSGVFKSFGDAPPKSFNDFLNRFSNEEIIFYKEGATANVAVAQLKSDHSKKRLVINGKADASTYFDMPTQILLGQIPMLLHPNAKKVFVVGFGSGTTIGSVLTHPVEKVTCAEISKEVIDAAKYFSKENYNCVSDKRLRLINEDAHTLLKLSKEKYDVIISEPSNPWIAGIGNLFSKEYFKKCFDKLDDNGIMVQWFHLYEANDEVVRLVLSTFASVFPYCQLWNSVANDIILVGSKKEIPLNLERLTQEFQSPKVAADLNRVRIHNPFTFLACQSYSPRGFSQLVAQQPINSETKPVLEFLAPRALYAGNRSTYIYSADEKFDTLNLHGLLVKDFVNQTKPSKAELIDVINYNLDRTNNFKFAYGLSRYLSELYPNDYLANLLKARSLEKLTLNNLRSYTLEKLVREYPDSVQIVKDYNNSLLLKNLNSTTFLHIFSIENQARVFLKTTAQDSLSQIKVYSQLAKAYFENSEFDKAEELCDRTERYIMQSPHLLKGFDPGDFFYVYAMLNLYKQNYAKVYIYYLSLINRNEKYVDLFRLRGLVAWQLEQDKVQGLIK